MEILLYTKKLLFYKKEKNFKSIIINELTKNVLDEDHVNYNLILHLH